MTLEDRVKRLEDVEAIRTLTITYAHCVDKGWNGKQVDLEKLNELFTIDAVWKSAAAGVDIKGREAIISRLRVSANQPQLSMHSFTNGLIRVHGDTASAIWLLWVGLRTDQGTNQVYQSEDLTYVRTPDGWRIESLDLHFGQMLQ